MTLFEPIKKRGHHIEVSEESISLLKQVQEKSRDTLGRELTYDEIIKLNLDKPTIIVIGNGEQGKLSKKPRMRSIWDMPIT